MNTSAQERIAYRLRDLYSRYGYTQYKMSKFEEYDLYARNKDFLISDHVLTFTDLSGKLMALKPDVTLSIVKNSKDTASVQKVYYNENVYRVTKGAQGFREIPQMGLECLGPIDSYCISEVLMLSAKSLKAVSDQAVLDISDLALLRQLLDGMNFPADREALLQAIGEKNPHELTAICAKAQLSQENTALLQTLLSLSGTPAQVMPQLEQLLSGRVSPEIWERFRQVVDSLSYSSIAPLIRIDFSVMDDIHYYNGFIFKGFVQGVPGSVLSGGQYDKLMKKMGRSDRAIGFAVYLDMLDRLEDEPGFDVDTVLLYDHTTPLHQIRKIAAQLSADGASVLVQSTLPEGIRYRNLMKLENQEVKTIETHA